MKNPTKWRCGLVVTSVLISAQVPTFAALKDGLIAYWPLDEVQGERTPDKINGYDMELVNLTADDLVDGKHGKAFMFDNARNTLLQRLSQPGEKLPANEQYEAWSVSLWVNGKGTGQNDLRVFSEGSTENSTPLFNIGTNNTGGSDVVDIFIRGASGTVNHVLSNNNAFDDNWHLITWTQSGNDVALYIDGVNDGIAIDAGVSPLIAADATYRMDTTTIGGIRRATASHWWTGAIDDVGMWDRALSASEVAALAAGGLAEEFSGDPLLEGIIAHWPLDEVQGERTPDLINGYDMELVNLSADDLVDGKSGKAFMFDNARNTLLQRLSEPDEELPANEKHEAWSVALWVNGKGTGQNDLRVFSEGSTENSTPLFNIGTNNTGGSDVVDMFIRGATGTVNHVLSNNDAFDDTWHLITWTQSGNDVALYIDGVNDGIAIDAGVSPLIAADATYRMDTTTIGGIRRATASHWWTGAIDDVGMWKRALTEAEVKRLYDLGGIPRGGDTVIPLAVREFKSERPKVSQGDLAIMKWEVTGGDENTTYKMEPGGLDVTGDTVAGFGSREIFIDAETTYTITATRGEETVTAQYLVEVFPKVGPGWSLLDDFDTYDSGPILTASGGLWFEPDSTLMHVVNVDGNNVLSTNAGGPMTFTLLDSFETRDGDTRSVFFQTKLVGDGTGISANIGITNQSLRFVGDLNAGLGGFINIRRDEGSDTGSISVGPYGTTPELEYELKSDTWYKFWLDITNGPGDAVDRISVHVQGEGEAGRTTLVVGADGDRGSIPNHVFFFVAPRTETTGSDAFLVDNVFVARDGVLETDPLDTDDPNLVMQTRGLFNDVDSSGGPFLKDVPVINLGGDKTLNITGATLSGADSELYQVLDYPRSLAPGERGVVKLSFTPGARTGGVLAFLDFASNDQSNPVVTVDLSSVVPSTNQLVGHYRMDEASGEVLLDSALLKHGQYVAAGGGSFQLGQASLTGDGSAVTFNRAGGAGGGYAQARIGSGALRSFSVSMWVNPDDGVQSSLLAKGEQGGSPNFAVLIQDGAVVWFNENNELAGAEGAVMEIGQNNHLVLAYTDTNGAEDGADNLRIYINGVEALNMDNPPPIVDNPAFNLLIGSYYGTLSFQGTIDDVQVYAKPVTAEDALFLFNNPGSPLGENVNLDVDEDGLPRRVEDVLGTSDNAVDTDGDGLTDAEEVAFDGGEVATLITDPTKKDTDDDGLSDGAERNTYNTDPTKGDTDGDGALDGAELAFGSDPNSAASTPIGAAYTGFERAALGATSFAYDTVELGWTAQLTGRVRVVDTVETNAGDFPLDSQQLLVHNGGLTLTSDPIALDDPANAVVSVDVRVFQDSIGIENADYIDLCILTSTDGVNFDNEVCFLAVSGRDALAEGEELTRPNALEDVLEVDPAVAPADGDFVTFSSDAGAIPPGTTHIKVKIEALNNSDSERFLFDNIVVSGSTGSVGGEVVDPGTGGGAFQVTGVTRNADGTLNVTFESEPGASYEVESSELLDSFTTLQAVTGAAGATSTTVAGLPTAGAKKTFYRVKKN